LIDINILKISQCTLHRLKSDATPLEDQRPVAKRPTPKNKLSEEEVQEVLEVVNQSEFQSLPPSQIIPTLADRGIYIASESSFYRILRNHSMQYHRGRSKKPSSKPISPTVQPALIMFGCGILPGCLDRPKEFFFTCISFWICLVVKSLLGISG
jgi:hypothetical protein